MSSSRNGPGRRRSRRWLIAALLLGASTPAWFAAAALGSRFGVWDWRFGLGVMTRDLGNYVGLAAIVALIFLLVRAVRARSTAAAFVTALAIAPPFAVLWSFADARRQSDLLPPIYDVQTDWSAPISFSAAALAERAAANANPVNDTAAIAADDRRTRWAGRSFARAQHEAYPDIAPILLQLGEEQAAAAVTEVASRQPRWESVRVVGLDNGRQLEFTATTFWYGLVDDVAVRAVGHADGRSRIDVRSVGREGHIDLGMHAQRIRAFRAALFETLADCTVRCSDAD
ncbi:MAG: DUF1499 domain-containing protein [Pseudomonadota bacterium]